MHALLLLPGMLLALPAAAGQCAAESGPRTTALVELYTAEGCSSCPPADRWLSGLQAYGPARVVPIALHVHSWDYLGWKDPFAKRELALRQRKLTHQQRLAFVYTPQVMLQGREFRGWGTEAFDQALARINARAPRAHLRLEVLASSPAGLRARVEARLLEGAGGGAELYLAAYANRLERRVSAGESRGRPVRHDYVVLEWQGPVAIAGGALSAERLLTLPPGTAAENAGVAAFVQNRASGEVLQALMAPAC